MDKNISFTDRELYIKMLIQKHKNKINLYQEKCCSTFQNIILHDILLNIIFRDILQNAVEHPIYDILVV